MALGTKPSLLAPVLSLLVLASVLSPTNASAQNAVTGGATPDSKPQTGLIFLDPAVYSSIPLASTPLMGQLPGAKDLTSQFPQPGNQGTQNSCAAWAVGYALKTYQEGVERGWPINQLDHEFSPSFLYNSLVRDPSCQAGLTFLQVLNYLHSSGVATLQDFPYDPQSCAGQPDPSVKSSAQTFAIDSWRRVNIQDDTEVKSQIVSGIPVLAGLKINKDFRDNFRGQIGKGIFSSFDPPSSIGGHAVVIIGYDDAKQGYKIINSLGSDWGDGGYGWVAYRTFHTMVVEGFVMQDTIHTYGASAATPGAAPTPPTPSQILINLQAPTLIMNVPVRNILGSFPGMTISVPGQLFNAAGHNLQLVARFFVISNQFIPANPSEPNYRDAGGLVAVGTPPLTITAQSVALNPINFSIPYYALNLPPSIGPLTPRQVNIVVSAYVDSFLVSQTPPVPFTFFF
jgi:Papain family cysteine protease